MVTIANSPNLISQVHKVSFMFETDLIDPSEFSYILFDFANAQPTTNNYLKFNLDGSDITITFSTTFDSIASARPYDANTDTIASYTSYFYDFLRANPKFVNYAIHLVAGKIRLVLRGENNLNCIITISQNYAFTNQIIKVHNSTNKENVRVNIAVFDDSDQLICQKSGNSIRQFVNINIPEVGSLLKKTIPTDLSFNEIFYIDKRLASFYISYYESFGIDNQLSPFQKSDNFSVIGGKKFDGEIEFININWPFFLQSDKERIIGENHYDWLLICYPNARAAVVQLFEYDKDNVLIKTSILETKPILAKKVIAVPSGTAHLQLDAKTESYSIAIGDDEFSSYLGQWYRIDRNYYPNDYQILYENRRGGFSMMRAKGHDKFNYNVETSNFVAQKSNFESEESSELTARSRSIEFNTGYTISVADTTDWVDMIGSEISVLIPGTSSWTKMILETKTYSILAKNNLHNLTFSARYASDL